MKQRGREGKIQPVEVLLERVMPPRYSVMEKLEEAKLAWESIVGPILCKQSAPLDIENNDIIVAAENSLVGSRVAMMGGNIARALAERWGLEVAKVKVVVRRLPLKELPRKKGASALQATNQASALRVREEDVKEFSSRCLENTDFPQDAAESLARLRAFFIKRFKK